MSNTVINTNVLALNSARSSRIVSNEQSKASARLSSGLKINSAADDAAGLAISEKMRAQIRGLDMASKNSQDAISFIQVAEGGMQEIDNMIQRIRELTVQAANDTNTSDDRDKIQEEVGQLIDEIDAMAKRTQFNTKTMLDSANAGTSSYHMQVGANKAESLNVKVCSMRSANIFKSGGTTITKQQLLDSIASGGVNASSMICTVESALKVVTMARAKLGAYQNRLEYTIKSLEITSENTSAAESRIRDTDMAKEMMKLTRANVLQQAANSMLAQANQAPQAVLQLLR